MGSDVWVLCLVVVWAVIGVGFVLAVWGRRRGVGTSVTAHRRTLEILETVVHRGPMTPAPGRAASEPVAGAVRPRLHAAAPEAARPSRQPEEVVRALIPELTRRVGEHRRWPEGIARRRRPMFAPARGRRRPARLRARPRTVPAASRPPGRRARSGGSGKPTVDPARRRRAVLVTLVGAAAAVSAGVTAGVLLFSAHTPPKHTPLADRPASTHHASTHPVAPSPRRLPVTAPVVQIVASGPGGVDLIVSERSHVVLDATGPCWVDATAGPTLLYEGILQSGGTKAFDVHGSLRVRVGAAAQMRVTLDGEKVSLPPVGPNPLDITFATSAARSAAATSS